MTQMEARSLMFLTRFALAVDARTGLLVKEAVKA
jgi:hypothetical protein